MTDSSLMDTDFLGGTLGCGVALLFGGIWPGAPTGGLLLTPTEILCSVCNKVVETVNYIESKIFAELTLNIKLSIS